MAGDKRHELDELRKRAEAREGARPGIASGAHADLARANYELEVHKLELEMQNEELREARHELELGLARYTELFDFAPIGYALVTDDGTVREINHAGTRLLGRERNRVVSTSLARYVEPSALDAFQDLLQHAGTDDGVAEAEVELRSALGERVIVHMNASRALRDQLVLLALVDVTAPRDREARLARAENELREAGERRDQFMSMLSHELRNPLGPIRNSLFVLDRDADPEHAANARAVIERQVSHLARLLDDLLDATRIARGKLQVHREPVELGDLVRATIDDHRSGFAASGLSLTLQVLDTPCWVDADPARLVQVVSNVLGNAEKFTPRGGSTAVRLEVGRGHAMLRVRDTGAGVAPDVLPHLFEPFVQAPHTVARSRGGLGLGLSMAKGYLELLGGGITIASDGLGLGTEVSIVLPTIAAPTQVPTRAVHEVVTPRRVLVIDDNIDAADTLQAALEAQGHDVRVAYDGQSGLEAAQALVPDIVLCDIGLPDIDGYAVARQLRADPRFAATKLVALSGYAEAKDLAHTRSAGFDEHLAKPATIKQLGRVLAEAR